MYKKSKLFAILCALTAAILCLCSCGADKTDATNTDAQPTATASDAQAAEKLGEGENNFVFTVKFKDGSTKTYDIATNETTVGAALTALELIDGVQGDFGLYVKTVAGEKADYDTDGAYWMFLIDGEAAMTGVDSTDIVNGTAYAFEYTAATAE